MSSTRTPLTGNPLAVFTDARGLTDKEMQLWREMESFRNNFCPAATLTAEPGIKDQIIENSFWRQNQHARRALPSRIRKCRRLPFLRIGPDGKLVD